MGNARHIGATAQTQAQQSATRLTRRRLIQACGLACLAACGLGGTRRDAQAEVVSALPVEADLAQAAPAKRQVPTTLPSWVDDQTAQTLLSLTGDELVDDILIDAEQLAGFGESLAAKLLKLAAENPDARSYVAGFCESYPGEKASTLTKDDLVEQGVPRYMQWDERWGYMQYLEGPLGTKGCCPTCLSMVHTAFNHTTSMSPYLVSLLAAESGYCDPENGTYGEFVEYFAQHVGFDYAEVDATAVDGAADALNNGWVLVCNLAPGEFTDVGHYILVTEWADDGSVQVRDPYTTANNEQAWPLSSVVFECNSIYALRARTQP